MAPRVLHLGPSEIPRVVEAGSEVRVVAGRHGDVRSPLDTPTDVTLLDVTLRTGSVVEHGAPAGESRFLYVIEGEVDVGPPEAPRRLRTGDAVGFSTEGELLRAVGASDAAHVVIAGGPPLDEPVVFYGPFCMSTKEEIARAIAAYESGQMGRLEASF